MILADKRYNKSTWGWSKREKQAEMRQPATRYLVLAEDDAVLGFVSWQATPEEDEAVIYWFITSTRLPDMHSYELQLDSSIQRSGLGRQFMDVLEYVGSSLHLSKAMLTIFVFNTPALSFYSKLG
jgi:GNAT superfamily N-acetyltransferase